MRLFHRTTRKVSLTDAGQLLYERSGPVLELVQMTASELQERATRPSGRLTVTAPHALAHAGLSTLLGHYLTRYPEVSMNLRLSNRQLDLVEDGVDLALRVGPIPDENVIVRRLAQLDRVVVATPAYWHAHGTPQHPRDLAGHDCLTLSSDASQTRGWAFRVPLAQGSGSEVVHMRPGGPLDCSDGQVLYDWCLAGFGIAWRSMWEVEHEIASGQLVAVLEDFAAPPNGVYVVFPHAKHLPLRVRLWIEHLKHHYSQPGFWHERADSIKHKDLQ